MRKRSVALGVAVASLVTVVSGVGLQPADADGGCEPRPSVTSVPVTSQGVTYQVRVHIPPGQPDRRPLPMVFNLHGSTQSGSAAEQSTGINEAADEHGFITVHPDGGIPTSALTLPFQLPSGYFWNIPGVPLILNIPVPPNSRDDVQFTSDAIDQLSAALCVDPNRVFVTGASGGGRMASLIGCELADKVAAIAPVIGVRAGNPDASDTTKPDGSCQPSRPLPVLAIHGMNDTTNPYAGGGSAYWQYSVPAAMARWADLNGCQPDAVTTPVTETVTAYGYRGCKAGAVTNLLLSSIGGHNWYGRAGSSPGNIYGPVDMSIDNNEEILSFFEGQRLSG